MIHEAVVAALEPWVGRTVADTCVRATAIASGKAVSELAAEDVSTLCDNIRRLLGPIAPAAAIGDIVARLEGLAP